MSTQVIERETFQYPFNPRNPALTAPNNKQLEILEMSAVNGTGGPATVGILRTLAMLDSKVSIYKYVDVGAVYTDITSDLINGNTVSLFEANNDAVFIGYKKRHGLAGFDIDTDGVGGVYTVEYYNGTSWATLDLVRDAGTLAQINAGVEDYDYWVYNAPFNWEKQGETALDTDSYYIKVTSTTAAGTPPVVDGIFMSQQLTLDESVSDDGRLNLRAVDRSVPMVLDALEGIAPYYSAINDENRIEISYRLA